ncbi:hypothetical protein JHK82_052383 [Glycine max]|nr:hypothetical protein JHK86_052216 [Glycine max]KAG4926587.1 hypothetical protein JHK85_053073 [Glycine max]KAG5082220.1 hypothetical protein JHK84_052258 [Glycine max]KAG5084986.1 hypothetical protein JHK82_052383 [Glycine max]
MNKKIRHRLQRKSSTTALLSAVQPVCCGRKASPIFQVVFENETFEDGHSLNGLVQDVRNKHTDSTSPTLHQIESVNLSVP